MQCVFIKLFLRAKWFVFYSEVACLWKNVLKMGCNVFFGNSYLAVVYGRLPHERAFCWEFIVLFSFFCEPNFFGMKSYVFVEWLQSSCWWLQSRYSRFEWSSVFILCYSREVVFVFLGTSQGEKQEIKTKFLSQHPVCSFTVYKLCLWKPKCIGYYTLLCQARIIISCAVLSLVPYSWQHVKKINF